MNAPLIAQILTIAMLIGSLPIVASPVIVEHDSAPAFTLNVCHPLPSLAAGAASCCLLEPSRFSFENKAGHRGVMAEFNPVISGRTIAAPDPPPPKPLV